jgi:hypothetical protein
LLVSLRREAFRAEIVSFFDWYNEHRPHSTLGGKTPALVQRSSWSSFSLNLARNLWGKQPSLRSSAHDDILLFDAEGRF